MRQWVFGRQGRRLSWSLIVAFLLPLLVFGPAQQKAARAQVTRLPAVAALEFGVLPTVRTSGILGRQATDAVVIEMTRTGRYDVTPRQQLNQQLTDSGLTLPLNNNGIVKLGQALGVDRVLSGDVTEVTVGGSPKRAKVTLSVRLTDVITGELVNGTIAAGYSAPPPPGADLDDETAVNQALNDAAFNAVKTINNYTLPTATILLSGDEVRLNRGERDGLTPGQEMIVVRGSERVGKIRVTSVAATDSVASVVDKGKGIRPEDQAIAIFQLPGYSVETGGIIRSAPVASVDTYSPARKSRKNIVGVVVTAALAILIASFLLSNKNSSSGRTVSNLQARAFAETSVTSTADIAAGRVEITWSDRSGVPAQNIIEYHIYRNNQIIGIAAPGNRIFIDNIVLPTVFSYNQISFGDAGGTNFSGQNTDDNTGGNGTGGNGGNAGQANATGPETPNSITNIETIAPVLPVGTPSVYKVTTLYRQIQAVQGDTNAGQNGGGGGTTGGGGGTTGGGGGGGTTTGQNVPILFRESPVDDSASSGQATPIARPGITVANNQALTAVQVQITPVQGADEYVVEFATTPAFSRKFTYGPFFSTYSGGAQRTFSIPVNSGFPNTGNGATLFVRVGARNSQDRPGPKAFGVPNAGNFIYNAEPATFSVIEGPPSPPTGS
ncbi:MAG: hypothetical protein V4671_07860 [Armatimonadota bacterium]